MPNNTSTNLNATSFIYPIYNPYAGLDYEQETVNYVLSLKLSSPPMVLVNMIGQAWFARNSTGHGAFFL